MKKKRKFKMPTAFTTLLIITFIAALLTYIIPAGKYKVIDGIPIADTYHQVTSNHQSLWDIFNAPIKGFSQALEVALFILVLGGFLGITFKTQAIDAVLQRIVTKLKGKEKLLIPILMTCFAIGGTTFGMAEETLAFYPLIIPIVLASGYDLITAIMIIFIGSGIGVLGGLTDPFAVGIASNLAGISLGDGIIQRFIVFISGLTIAIIFVMHYAQKIKKSPHKSPIFHLKNKLEEKFQKKMNDAEIEFTFKRKLVLAIFAFTFFIMILSVIPWDSKFNIYFFKDLHNNLLKISFLNFFLNDMPVLGNWSFKEITTLFFISAIIIALIYHFNEKETVDLFIDGAKDMLSVALVLGVARGISVILNDGLIIGTILNFGEHLLSGLGSSAFAIFTYLLYIPLTFLIPSTSGLATASMPIIAPLADFAHVGREIVVMAFQAGAETMNFISPTQCVLIGALSLTGVPYSKWIKAILPFVVLIAILFMIFLFIITI